MNVIAQHQQSTAPVAAGANPFGSASIATRASNNAMADAGQQREIAEVQAAMVIAKKFPRDPIEAMDRILQACTRPTLAEGALYSYSRGGSDVTGPSIRLAEVAAQCWGNVQFGIRELEQRNGESSVEAFAWDIETNTRQVKVFQVPHVRHTRQGAKRLEDPRDVYELVANQGARRLRACILGVIPGDVIEAAVKQCEQTMKASADTSADGLKKLVAAFDQFGVTQQQIEKRNQCRLEATRPAQVVQLKKIWASLRDGMSVPADWFEVDEAATEPGPATASLRERVKARAPKPQSEQQSEPPAVEPEPEPLTAASVIARFEAAGDVEALNDAFDLIGQMPEAERGRLAAAYEVARDRLELDAK